MSGYLKQGVQHLAGPQAVYEAVGGNGFEHALVGHAGRHCDRRHAAVGPPPLSDVKDLSHRFLSSFHALVTAHTTPQGMSSTTADAEQIHIFRNHLPSSARDFNETEDGVRTLPVSGRCSGRNRRRDF
jgi:hypothetical protein